MPLGLTKRAVRPQRVLCARGCEPDLWQKIRLAAILLRTIGCFPMQFCGKALPRKSRCGSGFWLNLLAIFTVIGSFPLRGSVVRVDHSNQDTDLKSLQFVASTTLQFTTTLRMLMVVYGALVIYRKSDDFLALLQTHNRLMMAFPLEPTGWSFWRSTIQYLLLESIEVSAVTFLIMCTTSGFTCIILFTPTEMASVFLTVHFTALLLLPLRTCYFMHIATVVEHRQRFSVIEASLRQCLAHGDTSRVPELRRHFESCREAARMLHSFSSDWLLMSIMIDVMTFAATVYIASVRNAGVTTAPFGQLAAEYVGVSALVFHIFCVFNESHLATAASARAAILFRKVGGQKCQVEPVRFLAAWFLPLDRCGLFQQAMQAIRLFVVVSDIHSSAKITPEEP